MAVRRYEAKLASDRRNDERVGSLSRQLAHDQMLRENFKSDDRVERARELKEFQAARREQNASAQLASAAALQQRERMLREQDERLAAEISKRKTEAVREAKNIQRICEQSEELRQLEEKLKAAYMNKEREAQIRESADILQKQTAAEAELAAVRSPDTWLYISLPEADWCGFSLCRRWRPIDSAAYRRRRFASTSGLRMGWQCAESSTSKWRRRSRVRRRRTKSSSGRRISLTK